MAGEHSREGKINEQQDQAQRLTILTGGGLSRRMTSPIPERQ